MPIFRGSQSKPDDRDHVTVNQNMTVGKAQEIQSNAQRNHSNVAVTIINPQQNYYTPPGVSVQTHESRRWNPDNAAERAARDIRDQSRNGR